MAYLVYTFSGVFADGSDSSLVRSTKNGRIALFRQKLLFTAAASFLIALPFCGIDAVFILRNLDLPDAAAPLISLEIFKGSSVSLSLRGLWILSDVFRITAAVLLSLLCAAIGALIKHKFYALAAAFSLAFLPELLFLFGIRPAAYFSFANVFHRADWLLMGSSLRVFGDWGYVVLLFSVSFLTAFVLIAFAKKECDKC